MNRKPNSGTISISANDILSFAVEMAALGIYAWAAFAFFDLPLWAEILLAIGAVVLFALLWARFAAPKSTTRLQGIGLLLFKVAVFIPALWLLSIDRHWLVAAIGLVVIVTNVVAEYLAGDRQRAHLAQ